MVYKRWSVTVCQLMEVAEDAIGDVNGLHSKLDRKTRVETSNSAATEKFQTVGNALLPSLAVLVSYMFICSQ